MYCSYNDEKIVHIHIIFVRFFSHFIEGWQKITPAQDLCRLPKMRDRAQHKSLLLSGKKVIAVIIEAAADHVHRLISFHGHRPFGYLYFST